jgi:hypothetical protein
MERKQTQGFRVNNQANSNSFLDVVWKRHYFIRIVLLDCFICIRSICVRFIRIVSNLSFHLSSTMPLAAYRF